MLTVQAPLADHMHRIAHIPTIAVQGACDCVTPAATAAYLSHLQPGMELRLVPGAGHSMYDPAITHELVEATDRMRAVSMEGARRLGVGGEEGAMEAGRMGREGGEEWIGGHQITTGGGVRLEEKRVVVKAGVVA